MESFIFTTAAVLIAAASAFIFRRGMKLRTIREELRKEQESRLEFMYAVRFEAAKEISAAAGGMDSGTLQDGLKLAVEKGLFRSARILIDAGAVATESLFSTALEADDYETARTLLASEHMKNDYDRMLEKLRDRVDARGLINIAAYGDLRTLEDYLRLGYDPRVAVSGETPILFARDAETARVLVAAGASANARGPRGTALDYALDRSTENAEETRRRARLVAFLLENGAERTKVPRAFAFAVSTLVAAGEFMSDPEPAYEAAEELLKVSPGYGDETGLKFYYAYKETSKVPSPETEVYV